MNPERTVAALLADYLRQAGVAHVFGYPGESLVDFIEVARLDGPEVVSAVREASAAFMAEGAAMRTGNVGACLSTLGPGSTVDVMRPTGLFVLHDHDGPIVVHVVTQKGRGYPPAENDDEKCLHDAPQGGFDPRSRRRRALSAGGRSSAAEWAWARRSL